MKLFREACCASLQNVMDAVANGADRIELCQRLDIGGITPSEELIRSALEATREMNVAAIVPGGIPVNILVRPRPGNFVYDEDEVCSMIDSIKLCKRLGANGVVIGALRPDGSVDKTVMRTLIDAALPLDITFHRAFDECDDPNKALEEIINLGIGRLLTSGHRSNAYEGRFVLRDLVKQAAGRIVIMPGCGITPANIQEIAAVTLATEFHGSHIL